MSNAKHELGSGEVFTMNSITGKLVLALIRGNDYAHAGEEEAIELVLGPLDKSVRTRILDVGCGIGGTARYVWKFALRRCIGRKPSPSCTKITSSSCQVNFCKRDNPT